MFCLLFITILVKVANSVYVPGQPGNPWTQEEILVVKSKLFSLFNYHGSIIALKQIYGYNPSHWFDVPTEAKFLRLGFHDCLKYSDETGGCDGCLNWSGVGFRYEDSPGKFKYENVDKTTNNGLKYTVEGM